jgi:hypothetical protein
MARSGWVSLIAGLALVAAGCGQSDPNTGQDEEEAEVLSATESSKEFGDYELHFNALTTDQLGADIAAEYAIVRSKNRVLLNISITREQEIGLPTAVAAEVTAVARNLTGQLRRLDVREIREGDAIYYIAETPIVNAETLIFTVGATPESEPAPLSVSFRKQFFVDE